MRDPLRFALSFALSLTLEALAGLFAQRAALFGLRVVLRVFGRALDAMRLDHRAVVLVSAVRVAVDSQNALLNQLRNALLAYPAEGDPHILKTHPRTH